MRGQKRILPSLLSYLTFAILLVLSSEAAVAQTLTESAVKLKTEPGSIESDFSANRQHRSQVRLPNATGGH